MRYLCFLGLLFFTSCYTLKTNVPKGLKAYPVTHSGFKVGTYQMDITPAFGHGMSGFGDHLAKVSAGVSTRLLVTSNFILDPNGRYIVLVSCDLWSFPIGLGDYVIQKLHESVDQDHHISRENVLFAASHTHHSQGNFSTAFGYNKGSGAMTGFDEKMFEFIGDRIAYSIQRAINDSSEADIVYSVGHLQGITRNRSLEAFMKNSVALTKLITSRVQGVDHEVKDIPSCIADEVQQYKAIDPTVTAIQVIDKTTQKLRSLISIYGIHPTSMGSDHLLYSSDVFGVARGVLASHLRESHGLVDAPVVSFFNGVQGDVSPDWITQGFEDAHALGLELADGVIATLDSGSTVLTPRIELDVDFNTIRGARLRTPITCDGETVSSTGAQPEIGVSLLTGTEDGRSKPFDECQDDEGGKRRDACDDEHGKKKKHILGKVAQIFSPPHLAPVGIYRIGELDLISMPGEVSVALGQRLLDVHQGSPSHACVIGMANEYLSYFTTEQEYDLQHYEGGSTLYGMGTARFLEEEVERIYNHIGDRHIYYNKKKYKWLGKTKRSAIIKKVKSSVVSKDRVLSGMNLDGLVEGVDYIYNIWASVDAQHFSEMPANNLSIFLPSVGAYKRINGQDVLLSETAVLNSGASINIPQVDLVSDRLSIFYIKSAGETKMTLASIYLLPETYKSDTEIFLKLQFGSSQPIVN